MYRLFQPIVDFLLKLVGYKRKAKWYHPKEIETQSKQALKEAHDIVKQFMNLPIGWDGNCYIVPAQRVISGIPAWWWAQIDCWIGGLFERINKIKAKLTVAHFPNEPHRIHYPTIKHEYGHFWLQLIKIYGHPETYDKFFDGWKESRAVVGVELEHPLTINMDNKPKFLDTTIRDSAGDIHEYHVDILEIGNPPEEAEETE